jgi:SAM-dependent methyltransferase
LIDCPACGGLLKGWRSGHAGEPGGGRIPMWKCVACGSGVTAAPAPAEAHETGAYATPAPRLVRAAAPVLAAFDRRRLALLGLSAPARIVDAGAGRGRFVAAAQAAGFEATGIEPSRRGVTAAREVYGVALQPATIEDAQIEGADGVTLWHVLEHLDDPAAALARVATWLEPGGVLLVGVPNLASVQAGLARSRWFHLDLPRHRVHFTPAGITALLEAAGFEVEAVHHVLAEHNPWGMWQSLVPTRQPSYAYHLLKRTVPPRPVPLAVTAASLPLAPVAAAAELAAGLAGLGGTIAVRARRR